jgi:hypothetical protein
MSKLFLSLLLLTTTTHFAMNKSELRQRSYNKTATTQEIQSALAEMDKQRNKKEDGFLKIKTGAVFLAGSGFTYALVSHGASSPGEEIYGYALPGFMALSGIFACCSGCKDFCEAEKEEESNFDHN